MNRGAIWPLYFLESIEKIMYNGYICEIRVIIFIEKAIPLI